MRVAQVSPLYESVPPKLYGGTERVVSYLTEELVREGHDVTLFASGDSDTRARLVAACRSALRLGNCRDPYAYHMLLMEQVFREAPHFDVIHFHTDYLHYPLARRHATPHLTTLHGRLDLPQLQDIYSEFCDMPLVSISDAQRAPLPGVNWQATVYHGLPPDLHKFRPERGKYLAFVGRISPEKRVDRAIEIAIRCGIELKIGAKVDKADQEYFESEIKPLLKHPRVEFIGEIGEREKDILLGNALALMFPIDWPEPFGLVMIEAMACGTPVIACRRGSVPEVVDDGVTGIIINGVEQGRAAVERASKMSRRRVRNVFEERFTTGRMARDYLRVYERVAARGALRKSA